MWFLYSVVFGVNFSIIPTIHMTRKEIHDGLKAKGILEVSGSRDALWEEAFKLYFQETRMKLSRSCGSCYSKLRAWLKS